MGLFAKAKKNNDGWLAIAFGADGVVGAAVKRVVNAKPVVEWAAFYPDEKGEGGALERVKKEAHPARYQCASLLAAADYQLLSVDAPNVPPAELKTALGWRLKDMLDFPVAEATIDLLDIPPDANAPVRNRTLFAVAARNSVIAPRQLLFSEHKLKLDAIDIPDMAQRNISALLEPAGRGLAMLSFDADGGLLTVTFNAELYLSRRIDVRLPQLLDGDEDKQRQVHDKITLELQRSLDHFERQFHFIAVAKLVLAPTGAPGLHTYLAGNLYMPVEALDLDSVFDLSKAPALREAAQQARHFMALGAALRLDGGAP
ncbi:MSHA biogenesis protein MshI [Janthinobacterium sp. CG_23.3]|uniref:type IV pilus biogenesis protein PilM n=1 Tax=unclassified Janthinobacterium TaxID=2610881 RepID=UPI0003494196|nr:MULTISPECIES: hypothetical protein [unclassified Janthinobacterium]MEC5160306.1 MSHA biogenesis protein MshI [Janthinobacterium sp. CG_S6]